MAAYSPDGLASLEDISRLFRFAMGREPNAEEIAANLVLPMGQWVPELFRRPEFRTLRDRVVRRRPIQGGSYDIPLDAPFAGWAAGFFPLAITAREEARGVQSWPALFEVLFRDWRFRKRIAREWRGLGMRAFLAGLKALQAPAVHIAGAVEAWSGHEVTGWAIDRRDAGRPLLLELYVDGKFVGAGRTGTRPHEIGNRWGGDGLIGFEIRMSPAALTGNTGLAEVREATSGLVIGRFETRNLDLPPVDAIAQIRNELGRLRDMLDRIEGKLPDFNTALGFSLESYDAYFKTYYAPIHRAITPAAAIADFCVIVDATDADASDLEHSLASLAAQGSAPCTVVVSVGAGDLAQDMQMVAAKAASVLKNKISTVVHAGRRVASMNDAIRSASSPMILLMPAGVSLAPDALTMFGAAIKAGTAIAYSDSDRLEGAPWPHSSRHFDPHMRSGFDADVMLQQDLCGPVLAVDRAYLLAHPLREAFDRALLYDLVVRSVCVAPPVHIARILYHLGARIAGPNRDDRLPVVRDHLARCASEASATVLQDALQAPAADAVRVQWPIPEGVRAAIIIPTRDRLDLLVPCLGSIEASLPASKVEFEIIIVNNRSEQQETLDFLARATRMPTVKVLDHDGAFNWASMNNRAAQETDADILIFLNNDTVVLSSDSLDELCSHALRDGVGAVGARLLYEDGTIQHAGVVMDEWHSFASHEGVGDAANDPGYLDRHILAREVSSVTGACLATRADVFGRVGGFDLSAFPVEGNDSDYCLRLRSLGLRVLYAGQACLYHFESRSRGYNDDEIKQRRAFIATHLLRERWATRFQNDPYYNPHFDRLAPPFRRLQPPRPLGLKTL
jgi:GT2 family glycosyltransferase